MRLQKQLYMFVEKLHQRPSSFYRQLADPYCQHQVSLLFRVHTYVYQFSVYSIHFEREFKHAYIVQFSVHFLYLVYECGILYCILVQQPSHSDFTLLISQAPTLSRYTNTHICDSKNKFRKNMTIFLLLFSAKRFEKK